MVTEVRTVVLWGEGGRKGDEGGLLQRSRSGILGTDLFLDLSGVYIDVFLLLHLQL